MSYKIIVEIVFIGSSLGLGGIVFRKIPALSSLPESSTKTEDLGLKIKEKIKQIRFLENFSYELFLQKFLTKVRILSLKTDTKTFDWIQRLRENAQKKKIGENANYWKEIKKATRENKEI